MGLNEVAIGIPVPTYWIRLMVSVVGNRKADYILQTGAQSKAPELLAMGMVDKVVDSRESVMAAAEEEMKRWLRLPDAGRIATKGELRGGLTAAWQAGIDEEAAVVWNCISQKATSDFLGGVMAKLSGKKKSKL